VRVLEGRPPDYVSAAGARSRRWRAPTRESRRPLSRGVPGRWTLQLLETGAPASAPPGWSYKQLRYYDKNRALQKRATSGRQEGVRVLRLAMRGERTGSPATLWDTLRYALLQNGDGTEVGARRQAQELQLRFGVLVQIFGIRGHGRAPPDRGCATRTAALSRSGRARSSCAGRPVLAV